MKTSTVLKNAIPLIASYEFLCHAVDATSAGYTDRTRVKNIISKRLGNSYSLNTWLSVNHDITRETCNNDGVLYQKKMHATRVAWANSMIKEFAAYGD